MNRFNQIYSWCEANKPRVILEIGTWNGHNAARMVNEVGKDAKVKYIGFDLWEDKEEGTDIDKLENNAKATVTEDSVRSFLKSYDIELIKGNTRDTLPAYCRGKKPFVDMVVIDGGHSQGTIKSDFLTVLQIVKPTGTVFLDDYYFGCQIPKMGAQTVMCNIQVPYTVLPIADRANDGSIIKLVEVKMRDVPRIDAHDVPEEKAWKFNPAA